MADVIVLNVRENCSLDQDDDSSFVLACRMGYSRVKKKLRNCRIVKMGNVEISQMKGEIVQNGGEYCRLYQDYNSNADLTCRMVNNMSKFTSKIGYFFTFFQCCLRRFV